MLFVLLGIEDVVELDHMVIGTQLLIEKHTFDHRERIALCSTCSRLAVDGCNHRIDDVVCRNVRQLLVTETTKSESMGQQGMQGFMQEQKSSIPYRVRGLLDLVQT